MTRTVTVNVIGTKDARDRTVKRDETVHVLRDPRFVYPRRNEIAYADHERYCNLREQLKSHGYESDTEDATQELQNAFDENFINTKFTYETDYDVGLEGEVKLVLPELRYCDIHLDNTSIKAGEQHEMFNRLSTCQPGPSFDEKSTTEAWAWIRKELFEQGWVDESRAPLVVELVYRDRNDDGSFNHVSQPVYGKSLAEGAAFSQETAEWMEERVKGLRVPSYSDTMVVRVADRFTDC